MFEVKVKHVINEATGEVDEVIVNEKELAAELKKAEFSDKPYMLDEDNEESFVERLMREVDELNSGK